MQKDFDDATDYGVHRHIADQTFAHSGALVSGLPDSISHFEEAGGEMRKSAHLLRMKSTVDVEMCMISQKKRNKVL